MIDRKTKEIEGTKIVHKHSAPCWFTILFTLLLIAIPVVTCFVPFFKVTQLEPYPSTLPAIQGGDFTNISIVSWAFGKGNASFSSFLNAISLGKYAWLGSAFNVAMGVCIFLLAVIAIYVIVLFIWMLKFLFVGRVNDYRKAAGCSIPLFIFNLIFFGLFITLNFLMPLSYKESGATEVPFKTDCIFCYVFVGLSLLLMILLWIIYNVSFKNHVYAGDIKYVDVPKEDRIQLDVTKIVYKPAKGLPPQISSIGGHAYAQNTNLEYAIIPEGIPSLGNGAFSNCLNLQIVTIPLSVKSIGKNCFFNTPKLTRINYAGNKEQWRHVVRGSNWLLKSGTVKVVCVDSILMVNPYN